MFCLFILLSGDIELNPGPATTRSMARKAAAVDGAAVVITTTMAAPDRPTSTTIAAPDRPSEVPKTPRDPVQDRETSPPTETHQQPAARLQTHTGAISSPPEATRGMEQLHGPLRTDAPSEDFIEGIRALLLVQGSQDARTGDNGAAGATTPEAIPIDSEAARTVLKAAFGSFPANGVSEEDKALFTACIDSTFPTYLPDPPIPPSPGTAMPPLFDPESLEPSPGAFPAKGVGENKALFPPSPQPDYPNPPSPGTITIPLFDPVSYEPPSPTLTPSDTDTEEYFTPDSIPTIFTKNGLHSIHLNINGLLAHHGAKLEQIREWFKDGKVHILSFSETKLDESITDQEIEIVNYTVIRNDRNRNGGGVCMYVHNNCMGGSDFNTR